MTLPSTARKLDLEQLYATPGDLTLLGLAVAARETTLDGLRRGVPELTASGYDAAHVALIEAVAVISAQVAYRAERLPLALLAAAFELLGIPRRGAVPAVVDVFVNNPSVQDVFWVEGSLVGAGRTVFEVAATVSVPAGAVAYGPVALSCLDRGPAGNVQAVFPSWAFVTTVPLTGITNPQPGQGGAWAETDSEYLSRAGGRLGAHGQGSREADLLVIAQDTPGVERALVLPHARLTAGARWGQFPWGAGAWGGAIYEQREGSVSVVARPYGGGYLSSLLSARLSAAMQAAEPTGTRIGVASAEEVPVDVSVSVTVDGTFDIEGVRGAVALALRGWLSASVWPWAGPLTRGEAAVIVSRVAGVRSVFIRGFSPASEKEDSVSVALDGTGRTEAITPLYPHVLLSARGVDVEVLQA